MKRLDEIRRLWQHMRWADRRLLAAVTDAPAAGPTAVREMAHILGAEETWLARMEGRQPRAAVWPEVGLDDLGRLLEATHEAGDAYIEGLEEGDLGHAVEYANSASEEFTQTVEEILAHVALHGQYHRGKVNLLLRRAGCQPAPCDYIAWLRGAPAATEADAARGGQGGIE